MSAEKYLLAVGLIGGALLYLTSGPEKQADHAPTKTASSVQPDSDSASSETSSDSRGAATPSNGAVTELANDADCPPPSGPRTEDLVAAVARCLAPTLPAQLGDGSMVTGVSAEGRTLAIGFRAPASVYGFEFPTEATGAVCGYNLVGVLIAEGASVRLDVSGPDGSRGPPIIINHCA